MPNPEIVSTNDDETIMIEESDNRSGASEDTFTVPGMTRKMVNDKSKSQHPCQDKQHEQSEDRHRTAEVPADQTLMIDESNRSGSALERFVPDTREMINDNSKKQHPCQDQQQQSEDHHLNLAEVPADQIMDNTFSCIESNETSNDRFIPPMSRDSYNKQSSRRAPNLTPPSFHSNVSSGVRVYYSQQSQEVSYIQFFQFCFLMKVAAFICMQLLVLQTKL